MLSTLELRLGWYKVIAARMLRRYTATRGLKKGVDEKAPHRSAEDPETLELNSFISNRGRGSSAAAFSSHMLLG